eukprot:scaffold221083_cov20-Tisochrysis_lutea.AAC.2
MKPNQRNICDGHVTIPEEHLRWSWNHTKGTLALVMSRYQRNTYAGHVSIPEEHRRWSRHHSSGEHKTLIMTPTEKQKHAGKSSPPCRTSLAGTNTWWWVRVQVQDCRNGWSSTSPCRTSLADKDTWWQ